MSLHAQPIPPIPNQNVVVARLAFPRGNLYMTMHDELGTLYCDADFTAPYSPVGHPAFRRGD